MDQRRGSGCCCPPMDLMRSEAMELVQIIVSIESSHLTLSYLGDLGLLQFTDIKRFGEMDRNLRSFREQMIKAGMSPSTMPMTQTKIDLDDLEVKLGELEAELIEVNANNERLKRTYNELQEYMLVLKKAGEFFYSAQRSTTELQREIEAQQFNDGSLESPLLME